MWDKCLQHVIGLPVCSGHNGISVGGDSSGLGFYSLMSLGLTLVIMTVEFEFLPPEAVPFLQRHGPAILMHDNARPHVARICRQFLDRKNVYVLPWPAVSPDMNPIEHIWDYLGREVRARGNVHNLRDLENALIQEWNNIPNVVIRRYVRSMRGLLAACINSRGSHARY